MSADQIEPGEKDEAHIEASRAPLMEHLIELRTRLLWSFVAFFLAFGVCFYFAADIYAVLVHPLADAFGGESGRRLIYTALYETFLTYVKVGFFGALCISFPMLAAQIWFFVAPGLYRNERRAFFPFLAAIPVFFAAGAAVVYYFIMPMAIRFFLGFETPPGEGEIPIQLEAKVSEYLNLVMALIFAFGACFQLPVALVLLGRVGIVSSRTLKSGRRYAIVGIFAVAAVLTPPDVLSQVALAVPVILLYEISIWAVWLIERGRAKQEAAMEEGQVVASPPATVPATSPAGGADTPQGGAL